MYLPRCEQREQKLIAVEKKQRDKTSHHIKGPIALKCSLLPYLVTVESMLCKLKVWKSGYRFLHVYSCLARKYNPVSMAAESTEWNKAAFNRGGHHGDPTHRNKKN